MEKLYREFFKQSGIIVCFFSLICFSGQLEAQIADGKCKYLGNVIGGSVPADFLQYWNQVTPENAGKWGSAEPTQDNHNWTGLDMAYNFAKNNDLPFKQHTFIWGNQFPTWIVTLSSEEQLEEIEEWIQGYCDRYPDTDYIEVVNEPINDPPSGPDNGNFIGALGGGGTTGYDWIIKSFELARNYCPNSKLLINEYNVINNNARTDQYISIINLLKTRDLIDGIGVQGHRFELENTPSTQLKSNLDKLGATGLPVYITEFDLGNIENSGTADDAKQLELYERIFPVLWNHPAIQGITLWGYRQGETWQETAYLKRTNGTERPALGWLKTFVPTTYGGTFCYPITGIEDEKETIAVYPNPAPDGMITLNFSEGVSEISIRDMSGRTVKRASTINGNLQAIEWNAASGVYFVQMKQNKKLITKKLVVK